MIGKPRRGRMRKIGWRPSKTGASTKAIEQQICSMVEKVKVSGFFLILFKDRMGRQERTGESALRATRGSMERSWRRRWVAIRRATSASEPANWKRAPIRTLFTRTDRSQTFLVFEKERESDKKARNTQLNFTVGSYSYASRNYRDDEGGTSGWKSMFEQSSDDDEDDGREGFQPWYR